MKMDDEGSLMIEMSLITPVLIGVVFVVINLFVIVMNYSVAAGEAYTVLYNREEYILLGDADDTQTAESVIRTNVEEKTTFAVTPSGREHILDLSLNKLEEQLDPEQFFRVNRQMILNVDAIDRAAPFFKGRIKVVVHPPFKSDIIISEGKASAFRLWLNY